MRTIRRLTGAARDVLRTLRSHGLVETGLIKVTALKPVTESTNSTNTATLQTWQVVGCCPVRCHFSPYHVSHHCTTTSPRSPVFQAIFRGNAVQQETRTAPELAREDLSTFWAETHDSSLFGKHLAVVFRPTQKLWDKNSTHAFLAGNHPEKASQARNMVSYHRLHRWQLLLPPLIIRATPP